MLSTVAWMSYGERETSAGGCGCEETHTSFLDIFLAFFASGVIYVQASPMMSLNVIERRKGTSCGKLMLRFEIFGCSRSFESLKGIPTSRDVGGSWGPSPRTHKRKMIELVLNDRLGKKVRVSVMIRLARRVRWRVQGRRGEARPRMKSGQEWADGPEVGTRHSPVEGPATRLRAPTRSKLTENAVCPMLDPGQMQRG